MMDQPSAAELVRAVSGFIRETAMPQLSGHAAFHAKVAVNVLGILERELQDWPAEADAARRRLSALLGQEGSLETLTRALAQGIRTGTVAADDPRLVEHLWQITCAKVRIDQPGYSGLKEI